MTLFIEKELHFEVNGEDIVVEPISAQEFTEAYNEPFRFYEETGKSWFSYMMAVNRAVAKYLGYRVAVTCRSAPYAFQACNHRSNKSSDNEFYVVCQEYEEAKREAELQRRSA